jgi:hypothetical protein
VIKIGLIKNATTAGKKISSLILNILNWLSEPIKTVANPEAKQAMPNTPTIRLNHR